MSAPAGFGKTTLLSEWLATAGGEARVAWVSLDGRDTDPRLFWSYVVAAVRVVAPDVGEDAVALLADGAPSLDGVLAAFLNDLAASRASSSSCWMTTTSSIRPRCTSP